MDLPSSTHEFVKSSDGWMKERSAHAKALWAKSGDETGSLNLPQHLLDTSCAAAAVYDVWLPQRTKVWLAERLGINEDAVRRLYLWLSGIHDVGKATVTFQCQNYDPKFEYLVSIVRDAGLSTGMNSIERNLAKFPHGIASGIILQKWLMSNSYNSSLSAVVDAHHGIASSGARDNEYRALSRYEKAWKNVHTELIDAMAELTEVHTVLGAIKSLPVAVLQVLTGLVVMADWIASNQDAFPMTISGSQEQRLVDGMAATDLTYPWTIGSSATGVDEVFTRSFGFEPRPVQSALVREASKLSGPGLIVLEAETGVGKTEAALAAAEVLGDGSQGIYFAAPTMATANGLLDRVLEWARRSGAETSVSSMYLAHSKNQLSEPFRALRYYGVGTDEESKKNRGAGSVIASTWMSGRRRGLLSNIVVGTVDQVLMMALKQRYSMLRHVALAGKIIIFDEVHAYDTYTSDYLMRTIRWLSYYGASVIVMTATLPPERRQAIVSAYTDAELPAVPEDAYPLITVAELESARSIIAEPAPTNLEAQVNVIGDELDELERTAQTLLDDGGCALIICNTIARAQETYRRLLTVYPDEVELHHAGFMAWQRSEREDALRKALGPDSHRGAGRPQRRFVVATQVAEQSLDIDADVLITDIAPIDLIIQRIGRLHRHRRPDSDRPEKLWQPQVYIRGVVEAGPVPEFEGGALAIYGEHVLLATFANLPSVFRRPDDIPGLVRKVYSDDPGIPSDWEQEWEEACQESAKRGSRAHSRAETYMVPTPEDAKYLENLFATTDEALYLLDREEMGHAQVRDAEPTVEVIPIVVSDYGYAPCGGGFGEVTDESELDYRMARHLASSTVRLPARITRWERDFNEIIGALERQTPQSWAKSNLLKGQLALPLNADGASPLGRFTVRYSNDSGIEIVSEERA